VKAHRTDLVSFAFGLTFLALALWWLLARILGLTLPPVGWFLAGALILLGLLGLLGALRSARQPQREPAGQDAEATVSAPYLDGTPTTGGPTAPAADEWATEAVTGVPVEGREDGSFGTEPHWSPAAPPAGAGPTTTTRELFAGESAGTADRTDRTRELPASEPGGAGDRTDPTRELRAGDRRPDPGRAEPPTG
jgi:hypothetical protein